MKGAHYVGSKEKDVNDDAAMEWCGDSVGSPNINGSTVLIPRL